MKIVGVYKMSNTDFSDDYDCYPDSAKLTPQPLPKSPKIWYNRSIRKAEKQHRKGEEENAENRDSNER